MTTTARQYEVQMRTVTHTASETKTGTIRCECGIEAATAASLGARHQRSRKVIPAVYEVTA